MATTTTNYTWDPAGIGTVLGDGNEYVWGQGLISQVASGGTTYSQADGLGSVRLLTDGSGNSAGTAQYDAYGASRGQTGTQLPFGFAGEQTDGESGLSYLRARYDDPTSGRFLSRDPFPGRIEDPASQNAYPYVQDSPLRWTDETGACLPACLIGPVVGFGVGFGTSVVGQEIAHPGTVDYRNALIAGGFGAVGGALVEAVPFVTADIGAAAVTGATLNILQYSVTQMVNGQPITRSGYGTAAATGAFGGLIGLLAVPGVAQSGVTTAVRNLTGSALTNFPFPTYGPPAPQPRITPLPPPRPIITPIQPVC